MGDDKVNEAYLQYEEVYKGVDAKVKEAKKMGEDRLRGGSTTDG
jgi:hypothetical protein